MKHAAHVRDAGGVPARYIVIENTAVEQLVHVRDRRDVPAGDGPIRAGGVCIVIGPLSDRRLQGGPSCKGIGSRHVSPFKKHVSISSRLPQ